MGTPLVIKNVRVLHQDVFEAKEYKGKSRFGGSFLLPKNDPQVKAINEAMAVVAKEAYGSKATQVLAGIKGNSQKCFFRDGAEKGHEDQMVIAAYRQESQGRVAVVDQKKNPLLPADGKPYRGCYVNINIDLYDSENGIHAGLIAVQFVKDGEAFSGAGPATADAFDEIAEGAEADDLTS